MKYKYSFLFKFLLVFTFSCSSNTEYEKLNYFGDKIIIIPESECESCLSKNITVIFNHLKELQDHEVQIVFTGITKHKLFELRYGDMVSKFANIHYDSLNYLNDLPYNISDEIIYIKSEKEYVTENISNFLKGKI